MSRRLVREEKFAIINRENRIRVLLQDEAAALTVAKSLSRNLSTTGPYRVARVQVEEVIASYE